MEGVFATSCMKGVIYGPALKTTSSRRHGAGGRRARGVAGVSTSAQAGTCPTIIDTAGFGATDCNVLLTLNSTAGGGFSVTATTPQTTPYDGSDDNYIGILNKTGHSLSGTFDITGPTTTHYGGIFGGMDGDGICDTARFSTPGGFGCTGTVIGIGAGQNYAPVGVILDGLTSNSGTVTFVGGFLTISSACSRSRNQRAPAVSSFILLRSRQRYR